VKIAVALSYVLGAVTIYRHPEVQWTAREQAAFLVALALVSMLEAVADWVERTGS
jgi:hypothetical protein